ncbi:MAG: flagellar motor protein MotA, partial [Rhodospirillales bacterium]|nr:flagellar motor protein MotA [Rhodospirillales bacterium]
MTRPRRYLLRMLLFVFVVAAAAAFLYEPLERAFLASAPINGLILGVLLLGIIYIFRQVLKLLPEVNWLEAYRGDREMLSQTAEPRLLSPMARMLGERRGRLSLSTMTMRSLLDGIASRLDEARELSRYTIGLLIFLGLLGTFWGLLQTVSSVGNVIGGLSVEGGDVSSVFANLQQGLQAPLAGMGTAFSSSLFGLSGSLILGFLDLQAGQAQNRFFNELEEWLSGQTKLSSGTLGLEGEHSVPVYVQALLEQTAESLETLQRTIARGEENRNATQSHLLDLGEKISA